MGRPPGRRVPSDADVRAYIDAHVTVDGACWLWDGPVERARFGQRRLVWPRMDLPYHRRRQVRRTLYALTHPDVDLTDTLVVIAPDHDDTYGTDAATCVNPDHMALRIRGGLTMTPEES